MVWIHLIVWSTISSAIIFKSISKTVDTLFHYLNPHVSTGMHTLAHYKQSHREKQYLSWLCGGCTPVIPSLGWKVTGSSKSAWATVWDFVWRKQRKEQEEEKQQEEGEKRPSPEGCLIPNVSPSKYWRSGMKTVKQEVYGTCWCLPSNTVKYLFSVSFKECDSGSSVLCTVTKAGVQVHSVSKWRWQPREVPQQHSSQQWNCSFSV